MCSRWRGSRPLNGSSSSRTGGSWTSAAASSPAASCPSSTSPSARAAASVELDGADGAAWRPRPGPPARGGARRVPTNAAPGEVAGHRLALRDEPDARVDVAGARHAARRAAVTRPVDGAQESRRSCPGAFACRRRSGPSSPVIPGADRERHVVDGDDVAVPARHAARARSGRRRAGSRGEPRAAGSVTPGRPPRGGPGRTQLGATAHGSIRR